MWWYLCYWLTGRGEEWGRETLDQENKGGGKSESVCVWTERKSDLNVFTFFFLSLTKFLSLISPILLSIYPIFYSLPFWLPFFPFSLPLSLPISFALSGSIDGGQKHCLTFVEINNWNINTASLREETEWAEGGWCESVKERKKGAWMRNRIKEWWRDDEKQ